MNTPTTVDLSQPIPEKRKDPVIEFKRFLTSLLLEDWQRANPHYCIFTTEFHPCKEEGYDVAIYVTCGNLAEFNEHNSMVDTLIQLRADRNDADPDVITEPPVDRLDLDYEPNVVTPPAPAEPEHQTGGTGHGASEKPGAEPEDDLSPPDSAAPVVDKTKKKNA